MTINLKYLKAFKDNYIWLIISGQNVIVVDPGEAYSVIEYIKIHNLKLHSILLTHAHADHIGGLAELLHFANVPVYGCSKYATISVVDKHIYTVLPEMNILVIATPGHTLDGISYLINNKHLFCGDTLFSGGCGRVFTGNYAFMYQSLNKIKEHKPDILIYPAHEYTLDNLLFAHNIAPSNSDIKKRLEEVKLLRNQDKITLPTNLELELKTNPFLLCNQNNENLSELEYFIKIRKLKDTF
ncbi:MAG: hydroxyacylglutathione hydrolase [Burkholderiales bacterium]|nr:hydroxyacylglutathione hydrolase [Burkholderiales bacterium]